MNGFLCTIVLLLMVSHKIWQENHLLACQRLSLAHWCPTAKNTTDNWLSIPHDYLPSMLHLVTPHVLSSYGNG